MPAFDNQL